MQQLNPSEISDIIKQRIQKLDVTSEARNEGTIVSVSDGIVRIHGLADVQNGEMIEFPGNLFGFALNLERDSVGAVVLGDYKSLKEGLLSGSCSHPAPPHQRNRVPGSVRTRTGCPGIRSSHRSVHRRGREFGQYRQKR